MAHWNVYIVIIFLVQIFIGTLGNLSFLGKYLYIFFPGYKTKSIDLIIMHLIMANLLVILSRGIPETMAAYGSEDFLSDFGCKLVFYLNRVGRGVAFGSTCLLSVFQAITISPSNSRWAELKVKLPKYKHLHCPLLGPAPDPRTTRGVYAGHAVLSTITDVFCIGLMLLSCGSMVFILFMHKRRVQHMHRTSNSFRSSPETRATCSILILVSLFVFFYFMSCIMQIYVTFFSHPRILLFTLDAFLSACFSTVCPFVFMISGHYTSGISCVWSARNRVISLQKKHACAAWFPLC
ncbi:vomeronasal type-1 receptor 4-like [Octodon degus]|uniref:Vomeronasal type-1 receptor n=1 Tax=Octodon degus TaxID=10160 RepID=A0A6P6DKX4_OCTDE|nr:vomeronasal type-1 receptor 4-like [Octodon degus]